MIESVTFESLTPGPTLVVLGRIHGNEPCGTLAILDAIDQIRAGRIEITRGKIIFVPVCNPKAAELNVRFVERNLNRSLYPKDNRSSYEDHIDPILCAIIEQADWLLDLHSFSTPGLPFSMPTLDKDSIAFAKALGVSHMVSGWSQSYINAGIAIDALLSQGTTEYARLHGAIAITVECGQHDDPDSVTEAKRVLKAALDFHNQLPAPVGEVRLYEMQNVWFRDNRPAHFARSWQNFDAIGAGEVIARYDDGEIVTAPYDGVFVMPKSWAAHGEEWYYLAVEKPLMD